MKLKISTSKAYLPEKRYIFDVLLEEFLGLEYDIKFAETDNITITSQNASDNRRLILSNQFFLTPESMWLQSDSIPKSPLNHWLPEIDNIRIENISESIPVIFGNLFDSGSYIKRSQQEIEIGIDIFGSSFFMLTRYEELVLPDRDNHDRFPIESSLAFKSGFTDQPIVNYYTELLWWGLSNLWQDLIRKDRQFKIYVSHDIDNLLEYAWQPIPQFLRSLAVDVLKHRSLSQAVNRTIVCFFEKLGFVRKGNKFILRKDPYNNLVKIAGVNRKNGLRGSFNFIAGNTEKKHDAFYELEWEWIISILVDLQKTDQEIGLHPSYRTFRDANQVKSELKTLQKSCISAKTNQAKWGGRQHYLRWSNPETWQNYEDAGLTYDSSIGYAEQPGFRSGVCYEYPVFNLNTRKKLKLRERPLILMDASVLDYMNGSWALIKDEAIRFANIIRLFSGDFILLCHNCRLSKRKAIETYDDILKSISVLVKKPR